MHIYTLGYKQYCIIYFAAKIVLPLATGSSFSWPLDLSIYFILCHLSTSLISGTKGAAGSSCISPSPALESAASPRIPSSFYWRMVLKTLGHITFYECQLNIDIIQYK